jgi:hypothetical protein
LGIKQQISTDFCTSFVADYLHTWIGGINGLTKSKWAAVSYRCQIAIRGLISAETGYFVKPQCPLATVLATFTTHPLSPENLYSEFLGFYYSQANTFYYTT